MRFCACASSAALSTPLAVMSPRWMHRSGSIPCIHLSAASQFDTSNASVVEKCVSETMAIFISGSVRDFDLHEIGTPIHPERRFVAIWQTQCRAARHRIRIGIRQIQNAGTELDIV